MAIPLVSRVQLLWQGLLRPLQDPARRYRHATLIHAVRVALGLLTSMVLTTGINLPHGEWASITLLVVIGGLQHHGNIRRKAAERALGTVIGAGVGLAVILQQAYFQIPWLSSLLIVIACGFCAYHAIGKGGYIALLSAITILIVAGHGDSAMADGLWRAVDVLIGIAIALLFSFALPLHATYSWRYTLADILRGCAKTYTVIATQASLDMAELQRAMILQGTLLVQLRSLMPSVARETGVSTAQLEEIQHSLRICLSLLEVLAATRPRVEDESAQAFIQHHFGGENHRLRDMLLGMSRALKFGTIARLRPSDTAAPEMAMDSMPPQLAGYVSLTWRLSEEFDALRQRLAAIADRWSI
jgi:uncharacterized membrane protein YccC